MGRPSRVWWWKERQCWAVNIGGRRYRDEGGIPEKDFLAACDWHARLLEEIHPGAVHRTGALLVEDLCEAYLRWDLDRADRDERSRGGYQAGATRIGLFCATQVGDKRLGLKPVAKFTAGDLDRAIKAWRVQGKSVGYIAAIVADVKSAWSWARRPIPDRTPERLIRDNPLEGFKGPPVPEAEPRYAEKAEAGEWIRWLRSRRVGRSFILLQRALIHSGARPSELIRATEKDVDWSGWTTSSGHVGAIVKLDRWKTSRVTGKKRRIFLSPPIRRSLLRGIAGLPKDPDRPLFTNADGRPWAGAGVLGTRVRRQRRAAIKAGHSFVDAGPEKLVNYRWRHTAASTLLMNGVSVDDTAELLGTSSYQIRRTYGHLLTDHLASAASKSSRRR